MAPIVGFDFDACLAEGYTFTPFAILFERLLPRILNMPGASQSSKYIIEKSRDIFYDNIAINEVKTKGTILRPAFLKIIPKLLELRQQGHIERLFIYSNNGVKDIINVVDHILALTLQKAPYNVSADALIKEGETNNTLHTLTPRIHLDDPCREIEVKEKNSFREKSLEGIQACLGIAVSESQLWYLDDTKLHTRLIEQIKDHYVVVKPHTIKLKNRRLAEILVESFPIEAFRPGNKVGDIFLSQVQVFLPRFYPSGKETLKSLVDKLTKELNTFSPEAAGQLTTKWKDADIATDYNYIENALRGAMVGNQVSRNAETESAYSVPIGGGVQKKRAPVVSRSRRKRVDRTRRRNTR